MTRLDSISISCLLLCLSRQIRPTDSACAATIEDKLFATAIPVTWASAQAFCTARSGRLADVNDDTVWGLVKSAFAAEDVYTGLHNPDGISCTDSDCLGKLKV